MSSGSSAPGKAIFEKIRLGVELAAALAVVLTLIATCSQVQVAQQQTAYTLQALEASHSAWLALSSVVIRPGDGRLDLIVTVSNTSNFPALEADIELFIDLPKVQLESNQLSQRTAFFPGEGQARPQIFSFLVDQEYLREEIVDLLKKGHAPIVITMKYRDVVGVAYKIVYHVRHQEDTVSGFSIDSLKVERFHDSVR